MDWNWHDKCRTQKKNKNSATTLENFIYLLALDKAEMEAASCFCIQIFIGWSARFPFTVEVVLSVRQLPKNWQQHQQQKLRDRERKKNCKKIADWVRSFIFRTETEFGWYKRAGKRTYTQSNGKEEFPLKCSQWSLCYLIELLPLYLCRAVVWVLFFPVPLHFTSRNFIFGLIFASVWMVV